MKNLYHGTIYLFDEINVTEGRGYKDFGKGFYATAIPAHAERIAIRNKRMAGTFSAKSKTSDFPILFHINHVLFSGNNKRCGDVCGIIAQNIKQH